MKSSSASTGPSKNITLTREAILCEARSLIGVPFNHQGKDPDAGGVDCRGLLLVIAERLGYQLTREYRSNYARDPDPVELREALETEMDRLPSLADAVPADIFLIRFPRQQPDQATHLGMLAAGPYEPLLIHAHAGDYAGQVIEEPLRRWQPYLVAAFRFRGID